ncbi:PE-PGRS family protein PE_PGRS4-like [Argiope bruennichi]|uniref:PE-PGRS family protein PE_PGRS4-like n=1 Tax=Argiope bruennichi TaxID=94029 RepID=UPI0024957FF4|nr:PE-PGRS family protein PE_PGRS4-like [Argiope bruennichi]
MFSKVIILCAAFIVTYASAIGTAGLGSHGIAYGAYGVGERGSIVPVDSAPFGYAESGVIGNRRIVDYASSAPVGAGSVGYAGQTAIGGRGIRSYTSGDLGVEGLVGYPGHGLTGGSRIGDYGSAATIGAPAGIVKDEAAPIGQYYINI